ncbi:MAG: hypothetical protein KAR13_15130 [Desulfobulbaceae bacterium]|nr:hypothetical protein [Desulfobulbaceae bacterium]
MALLNIETCLKRALNMLEKSSAPAGVEILSYKRNRGVAVLKLDDNRFLVRERGYNDEEFRSDYSDLARRLKSIFKREFPRSRKLRLYRLAGPEEINRPRKKM